ncbi:MAG TPA: hypothetical protein VHB79_04895 [Polyangiaceae bacterium]|nr:hypothetical protein [Polyangiaceae bacterium]
MANGKRIWALAAALCAVEAAAACGNTGSGSQTGAPGNAGSPAGGAVPLAAAGGAVTAAGTNAVAGASALGGAGNSSGGAAGSSSSAGGSGGASGGGAGGSSGSSGTAGDGQGVPKIDQFDTSCLSVPDPDIAASQDLVGMVGQWTAYFYKKNGTKDHEYKWKALQGSLISDTHIVFDLQSQRWFLSTIVEKVNGANYGVQLMVSTDATATDWRVSIPAHESDLIDNPQPTVSSDKVLLAYHGDCAWVVDKADLLNGNAAVVEPTTCNLKSADNWVAVKYGGAPPSTAYAVTLLDDTHLSWMSVTGTQAAKNVDLQVHDIQVPNVDYPPVWGNDGVIVNGAQIEAGEVKAMWQNDHLYWAKSVHCGADMCERLFDIDTKANTAKTVDYHLQGEQMWFGVPGVDAHQNVWMLASSATKQGPVGLALMGTYASGKTYDPHHIIDGKSQFGNSGQLRLGDYTSAAQDPDGSLWLIGMYAAQDPNPLNTEDSNAGCRAVHITPQ